MSGELRNELRAVRTRLGLSQQELARAAGVARQTVAGVEAGSYSVSLTVALRLAGTLGCSVEELFSLESALQPLSVIPSALWTAPPQEGEAVSVVRVSGRWIAFPCSGDRAFRAEMVPADGKVAGRPGSADSLPVDLLDDPEALERTVMLAGCSPALSLWARSAERWYPGLRVEWVHANSTEALGALARREIHAAGIHLRDAATGEENAPFVRRALPDDCTTLVTLGTWEEGLVVAPGNPKQIRSGADLSRPDVTLVNREPGSGARRLLDDLLQRDGVPPNVVSGYDRLLPGHLAVASAIAAGAADVGVSTSSVADLFRLGFVPLQEVRYEIAALRETLKAEPIQQLLATLNHRRIRSQLAIRGGYDTAGTGDTREVLPTTIRS